MDQLYKTLGALVDDVDRIDKDLQFLDLLTDKHGPLWRQTLEQLNEVKAQKLKMIHEVKHQVHFLRMQFKANEQLCERLAKQHIIEIEWLPQQSLGDSEFLTVVRSPILANSDTQNALAMTPSTAQAHSMQGES
jgi:hypothetical protein